MSGKAGPVIKAIGKRMKRIEKTTSILRNDLKEIFEW